MRKGWKKTSLAEVADFRNGLNFQRGDRGYTIKVVGVGDFQRHETLNDFTCAAVASVARRIDEDDLLRDDDLLFVRSNGNKALVGRCVMISGIAEPVTFSGFTIRARIRSSSADPKYISRLVRSPLFLAHLNREGSGSSINNLNQDALSSFSFWLPPLPEQRKIGAILSAWDEGVDKLSALRGAKARRLTSLRTALLFGTRRLSETGSNWPMRRLGDVTRELSKRNSKLALDRSAVMGVSNTRGIVPMREQTVSGDISRYKVLPPAGFAYNPMRINVGSIAMNKTSTTFLVSPDYVAFTCSPDDLVPDYLDHLRQTRWWLHHINAGGSGSVRQRTYYDDLAALQLRLPDIEEQRAIVAVLNTAAADVELTDREIAALTRQKRGLTHKLLTGEWPVKLEDAK